MKVLSFEQMEQIEGGSMFGCLSQGISGVDILISAAALLAFGSNPIGWITLGLGMASFGFSFADNPNACE